MQFKIYDVLASLIPGTLALGVILALIFSINGGMWAEKILKYKDFSGIITSFFLVTSYITGYIIHALGSWFEPVLWLTWGGRPSELLLKNKSKRLGMVGYQDILNFLIKYSNFDLKKQESLSSRDFRNLFQIAKNLTFSKVDGSVQTRISEFNNSYIFSRNILISFFSIFFSYIFWISQNLVFWWGILIILVLLFILWYRCRDRAFYYSREILTASFTYKNTK